MSGEKIAEIQGSATVDWSPLGEIFIKKYVNYNLCWQVNLAENLVAIAPYGGPVAVLKRGVPKRGEGGGAGTRFIDIYTLSGMRMTSIPWEGGAVVGMGWTSADNLVVVLEDGTMAVYNVHGQRQYTRVITREVKEHRVCECKFFHTLEGFAGFALMSNKYQFFVVGDSDRSKDELRVKKLADLPSNTTAKPSCWAVLPQGNQISIVAAVEDKLYLLDPFEPMLQTVLCKKDPPYYWVEVAISTTGKAAALVDKNGYMWGGSSDFRVCETEFDLQTKSKIRQMEWGGKDFFVVILEGMIFVKGTGKHWSKHPLNEPCVLFPEIDGVRILTNSTCEFMHRVSTSSLAVLRIGSMESGALLNDAYKEFEGDESHKADEYIRYIKDKLPEAVSQCIQAAGEEFIPKLQQSLLKSANFGKGFLGPDVPVEVVNQFVEMCHQLKVLNNVRYEKIGFPITYKQHPLNEPCVLFPEIDGVRILTNSTCEFMHRVSTSSLAVLRIGSMESGALLNDAYKEFEGDESHKADEYIRYIKDKLPEAVSQCIQAAGEEFIPKLQQSLLKSANFGKGFLGPDVPVEVVNQFVEMCHQLKVLNNVRYEKIGFPITYKQYYRLSTGVLVDRLINRGLYPLALKICSYLKIAPDQGEVKVLRQWAMRKVMDRSLSEESVGIIIINKLASSNVVVSFAEIARVARANKRLHLAAQLLDHEIHAKDQVPLLMEMKRADLALDKAIESGDPQLVYKVLEDLRNKQYQSQTDRYLQVFHHRPVAAALYKKLCKEIDQEQLLNLHRQESDFLEAGCLQFAQSFKKMDPNERNRCLYNARKEFHEGQLMFHHKIVEEQEKLTKEQADIERRFNFKVKGFSLFHTVMECVKHRQNKYAEQLRKDFKLSDNQFWWAKLRGLAHIGDYEEMEKFSKQKKSPIGYEPFVELCLEHGNRREAIKYIPKASPENRFRLYMSMEEYAKAAEMAFQNRSVEQLMEVQHKAARIPDVMDMIRSYQMKLGLKEMR